MSKNIGHLHLLCILPVVVCVIGLDKSVWFDRVAIDGWQSTLLQNYLHQEMATLSSTHCATRCMVSQSCLSFLLDGSSGVCKLFDRGVDKRSGTAFGTLTVYAKRATCEDVGYVSLKSANKCLKTHHTPLSWIDANKTCVSEGGNLISINSSEMLEEVYNLTSAIDSSLALVHIDGNDVNQEGNWVFHDGLPITFLFWGSYQPHGGRGENCMLLLNGKFHDVPCDTFPQKYLCERHLVI